MSKKLAINQNCIIQQSLKKSLITKVILFLFLLLAVTAVNFAQPKKFNYQAIVRNTLGVPVTDQLVSLKFSILPTAIGVSIYTETQSATTNTFGLVNIQVGTGTIISGTFAGIDWSTGSKFLRIDADIAGGTNYAALSNTELVSVPFALYALNAPSIGGTIIPFTSGAPVNISTVTGGASGQVALLGFGNSTSTSLSGGQLDLTGSSLSSLSYAFTMPRSGIITSISSFFSTTTAKTLVGSTYTITAQLYQSSVPNNIFTPITGAMVQNVPAFTGVLVVGSISNGLITGLNIPVLSGTRLLLVYSVSAVGVTLIGNMQGYASASINIQ